METMCYWVNSYCAVPIMPTMIGTRHNGESQLREAIGMHVKSVSVKGLFGVFDHSIPLHSAERVTIIHGPNGFGKTVMLRMIAALLEGGTSVCDHTPFSEFRLTFEDGTAAIVRRDVVAGREGGKPETKLQYLNCD